MSDEISKIRKKLNALEERILKIEKLHQTKPEEEPNIALKEGIEKFAKITHLSIEQLENVFEFNKDLHFIAPLTGSIPEKQVSFTQCVLIGLELVYQKKID